MRSLCPGGRKGGRRGAGGRETMAAAEAGAARRSRESLSALTAAAAAAKGSVLGAGGARAPGSSPHPYLGAVGSVLRHFPPQEQAAGGVFHSHKS